MMPTGRDPVPNRKRLLGKFVDFSLFINGKRASGQIINFGNIKTT